MDPVTAARARLASAHKRELSFDAIQPTSVAIAANGAFVLVGCTDGSVRLAAVGGKRSCETRVLGQLVSRGLNNSLLVTISIADDCRTAFAGAQKGATEVLAWDFSGSCGLSTADEIVDATRQESSSDSKLRGFVALSLIHI